MKTLIAPNGMKFIVSDEKTERRVQRMIDGAQEIADAKQAKLDELKGQYFLRVRARYEAQLARLAAKEAAAAKDGKAETEVETPEPQEDLSAELATMEAAIGAEAAALAGVGA